MPERFPPVIVAPFARANAPASLAAFAKLAASRPQAHDGADVWAASGPFSPLFGRKNWTDTIARAQSWEELADIGTQALNPIAQKARGVDNDCIRSAWELFARLEWVVAAAPDAAIATVTMSGLAHEIERDFFVPPAVASEFQWRAAKAFLTAMANAKTFPALAESVSQVYASQQAAWMAWAHENNPELIRRVETRERLVFDRLDGNLTEQAWYPTESVLAFSKMVLGLDFSLLVSKPLLEPSPENESESSRWRAWQAYFWRKEGLDSTAWSAPFSKEGTSRDEEARALVAARLPVEKQTICALGQLLAEEFGLRNVSIFPLGGADRAKNELIRAFFSLSTLSRETQLPPQSIGLGGLAFAIARPFWACQRDGVQGTFQSTHFFGEHSKNLIGKIACAVPLSFSTLAHEWTHAWDDGLLSAVKSRVDKAVFENALAAKKRLQEAVLFEKPTSAATFREYLRVEERRLFRRLFRERALEKEGFLESLLIRGTPAAKASAYRGEFPTGFTRRMAHAWRVLRSGSEKSLRAAITDVLSD